MPIGTLEAVRPDQDRARRDVRGLLCAALLAADRPLTAKDLKGLLGVSEEAVEREVRALHEVLQEQGLGIEVENVAGGYRLVVTPRLVPALATLLSPAPLPSLSSAALETLALVAYHQPITRGELEAARGASCSSTLETLQERELIKVLGHKDVVGKPLLYGTTERFLLDFGLSSLEDLPAIGESPAGFLRG
ncbi:MAG TPA: SMC-Scp complex subunit ScpB [Trueperaceae bacterium]|nr:SMC-Scp complex subunit ScpB [Trueperaceae bacterium]